MLLAGEVDAVIEPNVLPSISRKDPRVHRLFRDYKTEELNYYKATGIFPISHMVTLKQDFVDKHPDAPVALPEGVPPGPRRGVGPALRLRSRNSHHVVGGGRHRRAAGPSWAKTTGPTTSRTTFVPWKP